MGRRLALNVAFKTVRRQLCSFYPHDKWTAVEPLVEFKQDPTKYQGLFYMKNGKKKCLDSWNAVVEYGYSDDSLLGCFKGGEVACHDCSVQCLLISSCSRPNGHACIHLAFV